MMEQKAWRTLGEYELITAGDRVTVALSGGADSVALLLLLHQWTEEFTLQLSAVHLNHLLRGEEAERDEQFVIALCRQLSVPLAVARTEVAALAKVRRCSVELAGRMARYGLFDFILTGQQGDLPAGLFRPDCYGGVEKLLPTGGKIATAHTLSDNTETVLHRLTRGTGGAGLVGIRPVRGAIIRPLIACTRADTERYCRENSIDYVTDSHNMSDVYTRSYLRQQVLPMLKRLNPALDDSVGRLSTLLARDEDYLSAQADELYTEAAGRDERGAFLHSPPLCAAHPALTGRVLARFVREQTGFAAHFTHIEAVRALLDTPGQTELPGGYVAQSVKLKLFLKKNAGLSVPCSVKLDGIHAMEGPPADYVFGGYRIKVAVVLAQNGENLQTVHKNVMNCQVDRDRIIGTCTVRCRQPGDRLRLLGRPQKTVKKWLNEIGAPPCLRDALPVFADEHGPFWVPWLGTDERVSPMPDTQRILTIQMTEE